MLRSSYHTRILKPRVHFISGGLSICAPMESWEDLSDLFRAHLHLIVPERPEAVFQWQAIVANFSTLTSTSWPE